MESSSRAYTPQLGIKLEEMIAVVKSIEVGDKTIGVIELGTRKFCFASAHRIRSGMFQVVKVHPSSHRQQILKNFNINSLAGLVVDGRIFELHPGASPTLGDDIVLCEGIAFDCDGGINPMNSMSAVSDLVSLLSRKPEQE